MVQVCNPASRPGHDAGHNAEPFPHHRSLPGVLSWPLCCSPALHNPKRLTASSLFSSLIILSFQECYVNGTRHYVTFWDCLFFPSHNNSLECGFPSLLFTAEQSSHSPVEEHLAVVKEADLNSCAVSMGMFSSLQMSGQECPRWAAW